MSLMMQYYHSELECSRLQQLWLLQ